MKWEKVKLKEIALAIQTGPFGSQLHQSDYSKNGIPVVMPKDLLNGKISEQSIARVSKIHVNRLKRHIISNGDILYSRRGDVGRCAYATEYETGWLCGTGCLRVTINTIKANSKFIFYQLQQPSIVGWVQNHAVGSTMLNLNTAILSEIPLLLPTLCIQTKIADILSAYDDLIENNQKQIKLLEEAAQRLYKEWFVDLRFPGYENTPIIDGVPEGWSKKQLVNVFDYVRGKSYSSKEIVNSGNTLLINLKNIRAFGGYNRNAEKYYVGKYGDSQKVQAGDIIMSVTDMTQERRLVGHVAIVPNIPKTMIFSMDLIKLIPLTVKNSFLYSTMFFGGYSKRIATLANGTNVLHLKPESMMNMELLVPSNEIMIKYDDKFRNFYQRIEVLENQNIILAEARGRLLPKLMNGEVEV